VRLPDLRLHAPAGPHPAGRPVPVRVELHNAGDEDLWIVGVLDGSETGTRYPHWLPSIRQGKVTVAGRPRAEDPMVGPVRAEDFHCLRPGEAFDPGRLATFAAFAPTAPGSYTYSLEVSTESENAEAWLGSFGQDRSVLELVARVPRFTIGATVTAEVK
jgi:hypothetical protein